MSKRNADWLTCLPACLPEGWQRQVGVLRICLAADRLTNPASRIKNPKIRNFNYLIRNNINMIKEAKVIYSPEADNNDLIFWKSRSFEEKISVVQELREQYIRLFHKEIEYDESRKRLRRFYRIIK